MATGALAALGLCVVLAGCGSTPTGTLQGRLVGYGTYDGTRLVLTRVDGDGESRTAVAGARGRFSFADVEHGSYRLSLERPLEDVYECEVMSTVEISEDTVIRRFRVPDVDITPAGKALVDDEWTASCRALRDPVTALLCKERLPLAAYALPPRDSVSRDGYRQVGRVRASECESVRAVARLPGADGAHGWLLVSLPRWGTKTGWAPIFSGRDAPEREAWADVADAAARTLPVRLPALPGNRLPDLAFTTPRLSSNVGDACFQAGTVHVEWLMNVRNAGMGLAPKRVVVLLRDATGRSEHRVLGQRGWIRGLAPGESIPVGQSPPYRLGIVSYADLTIDPNNRVRESDESNNSLTTGAVPNLICR